MTVYLLYYPAGAQKRSRWGDKKDEVYDKPEIRLGGGSSTSPSPKVYTNIKIAQNMANRFGALIKEVEL